MARMAEAFGVEAWVDADGQLIELRPEAVEQRLRAQVTPRDLKRFGVTLMAESAGQGVPILLCIGTGGDEWVDNSFSVDFSRTHMVPPLQHLRAMIEATRPAEAYVLEAKNDDELRAARQRLQIRPTSDRPLALHWFHYITGDAVRALGGLARCLSTPAFSVEQFCDGVLCQLTREPFDPEIASHRDAQKRAMAHLGIP